MFGCLRWKDAIYQITSRETHLGKYIIFKKYFIKNKKIYIIIHLMTSERKYFVGGLGEC